MRNRFSEAWHGHEDALAGIKLNAPIIATRQPTVTPISPSCSQARVLTSFTPWNPLLSFLVA